MFKECRGKCDQPGRVEARFRMESMVSELGGLRTLSLSTPPPCRQRRSGGVQPAVRRRRSPRRKRRRKR